MREGDRRQETGDRRHKVYARTAQTTKTVVHEERENMDSLDAMSIREDAVAADAPRQGPTPLQRYSKLLQAIASYCFFLLWSWVSADCSRSG